jgi:hypothetical protein
VSKGAIPRPILDTKRVQRISAYLVEGDYDDNPMSLAANARKSYMGSVLLGMGFTFDDENFRKGKSLSLKDMKDLTTSNPRNLTRIFAFIGGEEVNKDPTCSPRRYVFNLSDLTFDEAAREYPDLLNVAKDRVKVQRSLVKRESYRINWWRFAEPQAALYDAIEGLPRVLVISCGASPHLAFAFVPTRMVYAHSLIVIAFSAFAPFSVLQSRIHESWARFFSSTLEDRLRYTPSDCFRTFPFPENFEMHTALETAGEAYYKYRAQLMIERKEGLTKTYNRFHARDERGLDIARLRTLHFELDLAVLRAYSWDDLADRVVAEFIEQDTDEGKTPKTRLDWPPEFKDEILARLLVLNAERSAAERAAGLTPLTSDDEDEPMVEDEEDLEESD